MNVLWRSQIILSFYFRFRLVYFRFGRSGFSIPCCLIFTKGECRGEMKTNKKMIRNLLLKNFNKNQIADISGLPEDVVNEIIQDIKNETK